jgi:hypothetical protein
MHPFTPRRIGAICAIAACALFLAVVYIHARQVEASVTALVESAQSINSTAEAEREIAKWQSRSDCAFSENVSPLNGDHTYEFQIENKFFQRLRLANPTLIGLSISIRKGTLHYVNLTMFTEDRQNRGAGVWIQEWFGSDAATRVKVHDKDKPWKAVVEFSTLTSERMRRRAFSVNASCFTRIDGCMSAEMILPNVWNLPAE